LELHQRLRGPDQRNKCLEIGDFETSPGPGESLHWRIINDSVVDEALEPLIELRIG
jgi:hypothetical protein